MSNGGNDLGPAASWVLLARGRANAVFTHTGCVPRLSGLVLRLPLQRPPSLALTAVDAKIWSSNVREDTELVAASHLQQHISERFLPQCRTVALAPSFLVALSAMFPSICLDTSALVGTLLTDATSMKRGAEPVHRHLSPPLEQPSTPLTLCFELKPKCGFVAGHWTVLPSRRELWWKRPQYALHQCLKRTAATGGSVLPLKSEYNPCDLFSRQPRHKLRALRALFASPQNNLAAFVDGIPTALTDLPDAAVLTAAGTAAAEQEHAAPISTDSLVQHILVAVLVAEELLVQLLNLQSLCELDPVAAWELYVEESKVEGIELRSILPQSLNTRDARFVQQLKVWARSQPSPERIRMLREYLLACMARDASVMVAVEPTAAEDEVWDSAELVSDSISDTVSFAVRPGIGGSLTLASAGQSRRISWKHQVYLVDLDRKPLAKIAAHVIRDACILQAAKASLLD